MTAYLFQHVKNKLESTVLKSFLQLRHKKEKKILNFQINKK